MIQKITIQNFRGIKELKDFEMKNLSLLVGENGTSKTTILEAINFCLSPYFLSGRIKHTDFYNGEDSEIKIVLELNEIFKVFIPDGYTTQEVECNKIFLEINKRDKATPNKAFSDLVVVNHYVLPSREKDNVKGWQITRKSGTPFQFNERQLTFPLETEGLPKSFYFPKNREKQLQKGFNSSISSIFDDFNWRFNKEIRKIETDGSFSGSKFRTRKNNFETWILERIDEKSREKTFQALNKRLKEVELPEVDLSLIDCNTPFDNAFLSKKLDNLDLSISQLGSGVEMVISLLFLETMAEISKEKLLILIDEPELHLHPKMQQNFVNHIVSISDKNQFLLTTHSPLFVKQSLNDGNREIQTHCLKIENDKLIVAKLKDRVLPYMSANEINFVAFGLATEEYHNELYNELETAFWDDPSNDFKTLKHNGTYDKDDCRQIVFDNELFSKIIEQQIDCPFKGQQNKVTKHTYIRNKIHHSNENGGHPSPEELKESILFMRRLI